MTPTFFAESDPIGFAARVHDFLAADPVRHTLPLTVLDAVVRGLYPEYVLAAVQDAEMIVGCAVQSAPRDVIVAADDENAAEVLARGLRERGHVVPGVTGLRKIAQAFASSWCRDHPTSAFERRAERLYRLDTLTPPPATDGRARRAGRTDLDLVVAWAEAFAVEIGGVVQTDLERAVTVRIDEGRAWIWETPDRPVSFASSSPVLEGHARIGPVFTPPEHRRHGYASNVVADLSGRLLAAGAVPTLFTDLSNPTSNAIYQALGYQPVADAVEIAFT